MVNSNHSDSDVKPYEDSLLSITVMTAGRRRHEPFIRVGQGPLSLSLSRARTPKPPLLAARLRQSLSLSPPLSLDRCVRTRGAMCARARPGVLR